MLKGIHPEYKEIKASCSCGNVIIVKSTLKEDISLEVCSACHPFYTGKQKLVDTSGRVERFEKRFGKKQISSKKVDVTKEERDEKHEEVLEKSTSKAKETKAKETEKLATKETKKASKKNLKKKVTIKKEGGKVKEETISKVKKSTSPKK